MADKKTCDCQEEIVDRSDMDVHYTECNCGDVVEMKSDPITEVKKWVRELIFPGKTEDFIQELKEYHQPGVERFYEVCFYTDNHRYRIVATDWIMEKKSYLGCDVTARKRRAGETWDRGNDLPDGPISKKTWNTIVRSIVCYELVKLSQFKKPNDIPEDTA